MTRGAGLVLQCTQAGPHSSGQTPRCRPDPAVQAGPRSAGRTPRAARPLAGRPGQSPGDGGSHSGFAQARPTPAPPTPPPRPSLSNRRSGPVGRAPLPPRGQYEPRTRGHARQTVGCAQIYRWGNGGAVEWSVMTRPRPRRGPASELRFAFPCVRTRRSV